MLGTFRWDARFEGCGWESADGYLNLRDGSFGELFCGVFAWLEGEVLFREVDVRACRTCALNSKLRIAVRRSA